MIPKRLSFSRREFLRLGGAAVSSAALLAACGGSTNNANSPVTITFWNGLYPTSDPNDKTKKASTFFIHQSVARFEAQNPGIKVNFQDVPQTTDMFTQYRVASIARNGPDVMALWSGSYMLQFKQYLEPLNNYFTSKEMTRIRGWDAVTEGYKSGGTIYGVPSVSAGITTIFYNKNLLAKAGINPATDWPKNFDGFLTMLGKIKAAGITPLVLFDNGYTFCSLDYWIAQVVDGDAGIEELVTGKRNFSDPDLVEVAQKWAQLAKYTVPGAPTMNGGQALQVFLQGQAAMIIDVASSVSDMRTALGDALDTRKLPDFSETVPVRNSGIGGSGGAFIISNYSKHVDAAVKFVKFVMSQPEQTKQAEDDIGDFINVTDVNLTQVYKDPIKFEVQEWALEPNAMFWPDNIYPAELTNELAAQAQLAWSGSISPQEFMHRLDVKRNALLQAPQQ